MDYIELKDVDGSIRRIQFESLMEYMTTKDFMLFGMDRNTILQLRAEYLKKGGPLPITAESVRDTFLCSNGQR